MMELDDKALRYWARAYAWDIEEAWTLIECGFDPRDYGRGRTLAPGEERDFLWFVDRLKHFNGRATVDLAKARMASPSEWIELCDKAEFPIPPKLRAAVEDARREAGKKQKPIPTDNKLLGTLAALMAAWPGGKLPSGKELEKAAASVGVAIADDTIRAALKAAREMATGLPPA
jgi:hypothetical protein